MNGVVNAADLMNGVVNAADLMNGVVIGGELPVAKGAVIAGRHRATFTLRAL
jgi:phosphoribosylaminoimidazole (AIR) synthetase